MVHLELMVVVVSEKSEESTESQLKLFFQEKLSSLGRS